MARPVQARSFVAVGDSFTEGLDDPRPGGNTYRGWADLVAECLAVQEPAFRYANLAVRGRLLDAVADQQVPAAVDMEADLISFCAGGNDVLRRNFDPDRLTDRLDRVTERLRATGASVLLFTSADLTSQLPGMGLLLPRIALLNEIIRRVARAHEAVLVDLWADRGLADPRHWSDDRLHLGPSGHRRVAWHVLTALGQDCEPEWRADLPSVPPLHWVRARRRDLRWAGRHFAPWIYRRLIGRSSGDAITAKRPLLEPFHPTPES